MNNNTLTWEEFDRHCGDECIVVSNRGPVITQVAIRTGDGVDRGVAAIHREGDVLIFDMGHRLDNKETT